MGRHGLAEHARDVRPGQSDRAADRAEFLVGNGRYRFDAAQSTSEATADYAAADGASEETHGWDDTSSPFRPPALTELVGNEIGNRIHKHEKRMAELAEEKSREILITALQKYASSHTAESTTSTVGSETSAVIGVKSLSGS